MEQEAKLSTEEIFSILVKKIGKSSFELLNYELKVPDEKIGLLGDHATLYATVNIFSNEKPDKDCPKQIRTCSFFIKFMPYSSETQLKFCLETGAFKKEIFVYELFERIRTTSKLLVCVPEYYYSVENKVLVTENLAERNYKLVDKMKTLNYETVLVVLNSLAKLHASTIVYEENQSKHLCKEYRLLDEHKSDFEETYFNDRENFVNLRGVEASLKGILSEIDIFECPETLHSGKNFKDVLKSIYFKLYQLVKPKSTIRNVICHGDLWSTNFLIKFNEKNEPVDCIFVDFQAGRYLPPSHDLMCFLNLNTARTFLKDHLYELIGLYYVKLEKLLKLSNIDINKIWTFSEFVSSCEEQKLFALIQTATYFQLVLADNEYLKEFMNDSELSWKVLHEDRTPLVIKNLERSQIYRDRLKESILALQDYCEYL